MHLKRIKKTLSQKSSFGGEIRKALRVGETKQICINTRLISDIEHLKAI